MCFASASKETLETIPNGLTYMVLQAKILVHNLVYVPPALPQKDHKNGKNKTAVAVPTLPKLYLPENGRMLELLYTLMTAHETDQEKTANAKYFEEKLYRVSFESALMTQTKNDPALISTLFLEALANGFESILKPLLQHINCQPATIKYTIFHEILKIVLSDHDNTDDRDREDKKTNPKAIPCFITLLTKQNFAAIAQITGIVRECGRLRRDYAYYDPQHKLCVDILSQALVTLLTNANQDNPVLLNALLVLTNLYNDNTITDPLFRHIDTTPDHFDLHVLVGFICKFETPAVAQAFSTFIQNNPEVQLLLNQARTQGNGTVLHRAIRNGCLEITRVLVENGADPRAITHDEISVLKESLGIRVYDHEGATCVFEHTTMNAIDLMEQHTLNSEMKRRIYDPNNSWNHCATTTIVLQDNSRVSKIRSLIRLMRTKAAQLDVAPLIAEKEKQVVELMARVNELEKGNIKKMRPKKQTNTALLFKNPTRRFKTRSARAKSHKSHLGM